MLHCICRKLLFCAYAQSYACVNRRFPSPHPSWSSHHVPPPLLFSCLFFDPSLRAKRLLYYRLMTLSPTNTPLVYLFFFTRYQHASSRRHRTARSSQKICPSIPSHPIPSLCRTASLFSPPSRRPVACMPNRSLTPGIPRRAVPCTTPFFLPAFIFHFYVRTTTFFFFFFFISVRRLACLVVRFIFFSSSYGPQTNLKNPQSTQTNVIPPNPFFFFYFQIKYSINVQ